jgi:hypothetical protein
MWVTTPPPGPGDRRGPSDPAGLSRFAAIAPAAINVSLATRDGSNRATELRPVAVTRAPAPRARARRPDGSERPRRASPPSGLERFGAGDDLDQLRRDHRLTLSIVRERQLGDHLLGVLGGGVHRRHARPELGRDRVE